MGDAPLRLLSIAGALSEAAGERIEVTAAADLAEATNRLSGAPYFDAVAIDGDSLSPAAARLPAGAEHFAIIVVLQDPDGAVADTWLQDGADDVIGRDEAGSPAAARRIRFAVQRRRRDAGRSALYSTDLGTGLPHRQQLVEHLSQLLALREREPAPMAVVVLRIEGLGAQPGRGGATTDALRRKLAVRLRAGVRASDVVAAHSGDSFAVLLGSLLAPGDAERVAGKLAAALISPMTVAGVEREVAVGFGIARYPQDGTDAERLLRRAAALAAAAPASGRSGPSAARGAEGEPRVAANDDGA